MPDTTSPTGLRVDISATKTADALVQSYPDTAKELSAMDGFSTTGGVILEFSSPIDPTGLVDLPDATPPVTGPVLDANDFKLPDAPMLLVNVDPDSPDQGKPVGLIPTWWEQAKDQFFTTSEYTLIAQPAVPLAPGTRYAFVATNKLLAKDGTPVGRSPDMDKLLRDKPRRRLRKGAVGRARRYRVEDRRGARRRGVRHGVHDGDGEGRHHRDGQGGPRSTTAGAG